MASDLLDVLVIEEEQSPARDAVRVALSGLDVSLRFANGDRALLEVKAREPDLLLLDVAAAGSDVTAFIEQVRVTLKRVPWLLLFAPGSGRSAPPAILGLEELRTACITALGRHGSPASFKTWRALQVSEAASRIEIERRRLTALGVLDASGNPTSLDLPADMRAGSKSDVTT